MYVPPYFNRTFVGIASVRFFRGCVPPSVGVCMVVVYVASLVSVRRAISCPYVEPLFAVSVFRTGQCVCMYVAPYFNMTFVRFFRGRYSWMCVCMYVAPYFNTTFVGIASVRFFRWCFS